MTDSLFFISSSHFNRFYWYDTFKGVLNISKEELEKKEFYHIHNLVLEKYRELVPVGLTYYLAPFSIKKSSTINGLIFGSKHLLGIDKFLKVGWGKDQLRGQANFDIDKERLESMQNSLFPSHFRPKNIELFEENLEKFIIQKGEVTEKEVYIYSIENGCIASKHAKPRLVRMKEKGMIDFRELALTYSSLFGKKKRPPKTIKVK